MPKPNVIVTNSHYHCYHILFRCACLPGICHTSQPRCPINMIATVVRVGDGKPGSCCDLVECREGRSCQLCSYYVWCHHLSILAPTKCIHNNKQYMNGEKWKFDKCTTCECRDGLTFCQKKECKPISNCKAIAVISDECCPTCQGIYAFHFSLWFFDSLLVSLPEMCKVSDQNPHPTGFGFWEFYGFFKEFLGIF